MVNTSNNTSFFSSTSWPRSSGRHYLKDSSQTNNSVRIFLSFVMVLMILISISGNFIVCYIVYRKPAMRSGINLLLANLALSDLLLSVISMPMAMALLNLQKSQIDDILCKFGAVVFFKLQTEKILLLVAISVDRYYIIVKRKDNLNTFRAKIISAVTWIVSLIITLPPLFGWGGYVYTSMQCQCTLRLNALSVADFMFVCLFDVLSGFLPCLIMVVSYGLILRTVRRNCFRVQNHPPVNPTAMHRKGKMFIDYSYKTRTFTTISVLSFVYIICILPLKTAEIWAASNGQDPPFSVMLGVLWLSYGHTALNPVIYTIRIKKFREACLEALPKTCMVVPKCLPLRKRRRIKPYALYEVSSNASVVSTVI